jgi:predicted neutral ceramidase superfamily lipid hydrolase
MSNKEEKKEDEISTRDLREVNCVLNRACADRIIATLLYASARAYKMRIVTLGIFIATLGIAGSIIGYTFRAPWLIIYSLALLLIGIILTLYGVHIANKTKTGGGGDE